MITCLIFLSALLWRSSAAYKPIVMMHGFSATPNGGSYRDWNLVIRIIQQYHPGTICIPLKLFQGLHSETAMLTQLPQVVAAIRNVTANFSSYHLMGHSQGGLMMRAVAETMDDHRIDRLITLAGVVNGYYGDPSWIARIVGMRPLSAISDLFYTSVFQNHFSVANYWKSPLQRQKYLHANQFLPKLSNEVAHARAAQYKANFLRVKSMYAFGSPADGTLSPWCTSLYCFWDPTFHFTVDMKQLPIFQKDLFGLQTLYNESRILLTEVQGIEHSQWLRNSTNFIANVLQFCV